MDRLQIKCVLSAGPADLQFDLKKIPDEPGPCYMVSVNGMFKGYIKREQSGIFGQLMHANFSIEDMTLINEKLFAFKENYKKR